MGKELITAVTGFILAGGESKRMGRNKALIRLDGSTIIERAVRVFKEVFAGVFIVANDAALYGSLGATVYPDVIKGAATLSGVHSALHHCPTDYAFIAGCDMPYLDASAIRKVIEASGVTGDSAPAFDAFVPKIGGRLHPMHALYSKRCVKKAEEQILAGNFRVTDLIASVRTRELTETELAGVTISVSVENVNTEAELKRVIAKDKP